MKRKKVFYTEAAYLVGLVALAIGTALMERADFGMSMVVAPAYIVHLKLSQTLPWFSFGMAEYCLQAVLLVITAVVLRRFKVTYLFSFLTAVLYGLILDASIWLVALIPEFGIAGRVTFFLLGLVIDAFAISMLFHTYITPEAYELLVKELAGYLKRDINKVKTVYDCCSCATAIVLSFLFFGFGHFEGVKFGTVFCALVNGWMIGKISKRLERRFEFRDALKRRISAA